jgi:hypothetical protein
MLVLSFKSSPDSGGSTSALEVGRQARICSQLVEVPHQGAFPITQAVVQRMKRMLETRRNATFVASSPSELHQRVKITSYAYAYRMPSSDSPIKRVFVVLALFLLLGSALVAGPAWATTGSHPSATSTRTVHINDDPTPGASAIAALTDVYNYRPDLQTAFPDIGSNPASLQALVDWAGQVVSGQVSDSNYSSLEPFGYFYSLMFVYDQRSDLQAAYPNAYTDTAAYEQLVTWAANVVTTQSTDAAYPVLADYGYWYALMSTYNARADLQAEFPDPYDSSASFLGLVDWAAGTVSGNWSDSAYPTLAPFGFWYSLMAVYNSRTDLQTAFPQAYTNFTNFSALVGWAGSVVSKQPSDSDYWALSEFGYWFSLMAIYNERADLQSVFPVAYSNFADYTQLVQWAGGVVTGEWSDGSATLLDPFGSYYTLMTTYDARADLLAAFPNAFTNWTASQGLVLWAGGTVEGLNADSSEPTLVTFGYWYALFGLVYEQRPDLQSAFPLALTDSVDNQAMINWADGVVLQVYPDEDYSILLPFASSYEGLATS